MRNENRNTQNQSHRIVVILLAFFAFAMSAVLSRTVFERLPHLEDEVAYLYQARIFARGDVVIDSPEPRRAFWQPFIVDRDGTRFSKYTPGWSAQLALGVVMGEYWVINACFSLLTVALTYRLAREIFDARAGMIAAALVAFSPMALLLNATLMSHTSALFWTTLFIYAYWRIEHGRRALTWGVIGGVALGALVATRPLTGVAIALPLVVWSVIRLIRAFALTDAVGTPYRASNQQFPTNTDALYRVPTKLRIGRAVSLLPPLVALSVVTLVIGAAVPLYNQAAVGDPFEDLYRLVWVYDRVGFGEGYGRNGHTLQKAFNHGRFDLSLTAADLFGWQIGTITDVAGQVYPDVRAQLTAEGDYWLRFGLSWVLLPFGLIAAFRRRSIWIALWFLILYGWIRFAFDWQSGAQMVNPFFAWLWIFAAFAWLFLPFLVLRRRTEAWTWLLVAVTLSLVGFQMTYWIGAQRYSTRYYYEALTAVAILSALPLAWLIRRFAARRGVQSIVYGAFVGVLISSLIAYSLPRVGVLTGFNRVSWQQVRNIETRREPGRNVLVIVNGDDVRWRAFGSLMAVTSPYLDSPIVVGWNYQNSATLRDQIIARLPDRQIIDLDARGEEAWFSDPITAQSPGG
jgi:hypothetical protein